MKSLPLVTTEKTCIHCRKWQVLHKQVGECRKSGMETLDEETCRFWEPLKSEKQQ